MTTYQRNVNQSITPSNPMEVVLSEGRAISYTTSANSSGTLTAYTMAGSFIESRPINAAGIYGGNVSGARTVSITCTAGRIDVTVQDAALTAMQASKPAAPAAPVLTALAGAISVAYTVPSDGGNAIIEAQFMDINGVSTTLTSSPQTIAKAAGASITGATRFRNAIGWSDWSPQSNSVTPTSNANLFMVASNRFAMPVDVGTGDTTTGAKFTANTSGSSTALSITGLTGNLINGMTITGTGIPAGTTISNLSAISGGSATATMSNAANLSNVAASVSGSAWMGGSGVESQGRYHNRRWLFNTTWAPKGGVFKWANAVELPGGVVDLQTTFTIQRVEVRSVQRDGSGAITGSTFVTAVKFGGAGSKVMTPGLVVFNDPIADLLANTEYFLDIWWTCSLGAVWPSTASNYLPGETSKSSVSVDLSLSAMQTTGQSFAFQGANFGPCGFYAKGWDGSMTALICGDSTEDLTNIMGDLLKRDLGHVAQALGDTTSTAYNYFQTSRYTSGFSMLNDHQPVLGSTSYNLFTWLATNLAAGLGQTRAPWQAIYSEMGKNNFNVGSLTAFQNLFIGAVAAARSYWPNIPWFQEDLTPSTNANVNNSGQTNDTDVTPQVSYVGNTANGGYIEAANAWIMAKGGGIFNLAVAAAAAVRSSTSAATYQSWKTDGFVADLMVDVAANSTDTIVLNVAPEIGTGIAIDAGSSNVDPVYVANLVGYQVHDVTPNGGNFNVRLFSAQRAPVAKKVVLAHTAGAGKVRGATAPDGNHQSHKGSLQMSAVIIAAKPAMAAIAAAYQGQ